MKASRIERALTVECPTCGQDRGYKCRDIRRFYRSLKVPHIKRIERAESAKEDS